jgi:hypothetical protein
MSVHHTKATLDTAEMTGALLAIARGDGTPDSVAAPAPSAANRSSGLRTKQEGERIKCSAGARTSNTPPVFRLTGACLRA